MKAIVALLLALPALALGQGSLTPPSDPKPTMRTLQQIEPRRPLQDGVDGVTANPNGGFTIGATGSYYLTDNLAVTQGDGIAIAASNVTLDLNGFTISSSASPAAGIAIAVVAAQQNITIRNGHIDGGFTFDAGTGTGTGSGFQRGIYSIQVIGNTLVTDLTIRGVSNQGIYLDKGSSIERCVAEHCGDTAFTAQIVTDCSAISCYTGITGETLNNCRAVTYGAAISAAKTAANCTGESTTAIGLYAGTAINCRGNSGTNIGLDANVATNCEGRSTSYIGLRASQSATGCSGRSGSGTFGLLVEDASGATPVLGSADNCVGEVTSGTGLGLKAGSANNCRGNSVAGTGLRAVIVENCQGTSTSGIGLYAEQTASGSTGTTTSGNAGLYSGRSATNCTGTNQSATGMAYGLQVSGTATGCNGLSGYGNAGLSADVALNCEGNCPNGKYGLQAYQSATNCSGSILSATNTTAGSAALRAGVATGCNGENWSTTANTYGIYAMVSANNSVGAGVVGIRSSNSANFCHGTSTATGGVAISTPVAIGCTTGGGTITGTHYITP
jgi:hypothetical protein